MHIDIYTYVCLYLHKYVKLLKAIKFVMKVVHAMFEIGVKIKQIRILKERLVFSNLLEGAS